MFVYRPNVCYYGVMPKKLTPEVFVERVVAKHGDKVKVDPDQYAGKEKKITAECYKHGDFETTPARLWKGQGCPVCGRPKRGMTTDIWIKKARDVHGEKYDYSKVKYTKANKKVIIICPEHGEFTQEANSHLQGHGCKLCGTDQATGTADYVARAEKRKQTVLDKYGVDNVMKVDAIKETARLALLEKYGEGVTNIAQVPGAQEHRQDSLVRNGTFIKSKPENNLYDFLVKIFGESDVIRQYRCDRYPWLCDFYIQSRDMFIEGNYHISHGRSWFDKNSDYDLERLEKFKQTKSESLVNNIIEVWTERDVERREKAKEENLNYVVFWDQDLSDAFVWASMGCPDGHDGDGMYTWLPERKELKRYPRPNYTGSTDSLSQIAKWYNFDEFYKRELAIWRDNKLYSDGLVQMYLYSNLLKYRDLDPTSVTDRDILRSISSSRLIKSHSSFDADLLIRALKKYNISSVYDPCAGWGERMLACFHNGIDYTGVDINQDLRPGYRRMMRDFDVEDVEMMWGDSSTMNISGLSVDAIIACPPYGDTEIYSDIGAENLSDANFIDWWDKVVSNAMSTNAQYFFLQINQKWKARMVNIIENYGFSVVEKNSIMNQIHHFNKMPDRKKKEFESFIVLQRD